MISRDITELDETPNLAPDEGCEFCAVIDDEMPDACEGCKHGRPDDIDSEYEGARADTCPVCGAPGGGCITCLASLRCDP